MYKNKKKYTWQKEGKAYSFLSKKNEKKRKKRFSRFLFWFLLLIFWGVCFYLILFSPFLEIDTIFVEGNCDVSSEEIVEKTKEALQGRYWRYFPKHNFFLASSREISKKLEENFSRLDISLISKKFPNRISIWVKERQPELVWCSGGVCYFVDKGGVFYSGADQSEKEFSKNRFLVIIDDGSRLVDIGETRISSDFVAYLKAIDAVLAEDLNLPLEENYHTPAISSGEILVRIKEGEDWILKLSSEIPADETKRILESVFDKNLAGDKRSQLEYLDLRVKGKVYYKMKN